MRRILAKAVAKIVDRVGAVANAALAAGSEAIGFQEALLLGGCGLLGVGLFQISPPAAAIVPGAVLVYVAVWGVK